MEYYQRGECALLNNHAYINWGQLEMLVPTKNFIHSKQNSTLNRHLLTETDMKKITLNLWLKEIPCVMFTVMAEKGFQLQLTMAQEIYKTDIQHLANSSHIINLQSLIILETNSNNHTIQIILRTNL